MPATIQQNSTEFDTNSHLSPVQVQVAAALAQGRTVSAAALHAGVHRTTIYVWLQREPDFKTAVQNALREYIDTMNDELRDLSAAALKTLRNLLENPETADWIRLKTALAVLHRPQFPKQDWNLPERVDSPLQAQIIDGIADMEQVMQSKSLRRTSL